MGESSWETPLYKSEEGTEPEELTHNASGMEASAELAFRATGLGWLFRVVPNWGKGACLNIPTPANHWLRAVLWEGCDLEWGNVLLLRAISSSNVSQQQSASPVGAWLWGPWRGDLGGAPHHPKVYSAISRQTCKQFLDRIWRLWSELQRSY